MSKYYNEVSQDDGLAMSVAIESKWYSCERSELIAWQLTFTGTPTGTFKLQASIDKDFDPIDLIFPEGAISAAGAAGNHQITLSGYPYPWIRLIYTPTSGSGVLNYRLNRKGF